MLCKASVTEEELQLKKQRQMKISDMFTKKTIEICVKCKLYIYLVSLVLFARKFKKFSFLDVYSYLGQESSIIYLCF